MPLPMIADSPSCSAELASRCAAAEVVSPPAPTRCALYTPIALITISGAAEPTARKLAPATSSGTFQRTQSVSSATTMWSSQTIASPTNDAANAATSTSGLASSPPPSSAIALLPLRAAGAESPRR